MRTQLFGGIDRDQRWRKLRMRGTSRFCQKDFKEVEP
jgi:hypothetical protein